MAKYKFLSTPSGWRATGKSNSGCGSGTISIHALRVEGDLAQALIRSMPLQFLSTPSGWRATPCR